MVMPIEKISVVGIGKLGLCMASCFASAGYNVIGVDLNQDIIRAVNSGRSPLYEPGLEDLIQKSEGRLCATNDCRYAVENSEITFVVVPTPSRHDGGFATEYIESAVKEIGLSLQLKDSFHIVVVTSTVMPGATEDIIRPILERESQKGCGMGFGLCYNPEFIALGSVIRDFTSPDVVLIGESDRKSGDLLAELYRRVCSNNPWIVRTTIYNAELAKISLNAFVTMKISFANMVAEICEQLPTGDVDAVSRVLGFDSRIGRKYLSGGPSFGGPCFPRDNRAFRCFSRKLGCEAPLAEATDVVNERQTERIVRMVKQRLGELHGRKVAILGLTYKPDTDVVEESAGISVARALAGEGARVSVYDPAGMEKAKRVLGSSAEFANSIDECLTNAEFCVLATPWKHFGSLRPEDFCRNMKRPVLLDCWRMLDRSEFGEKTEYLAIGVSGSVLSRCRLPV